MTSGRLIIKEIKYDQLIERKVQKHSPTCNRITLPKTIKQGTIVYVVLPEEEKKIK